MGLLSFNKCSFISWWLMFTQSSVRKLAQNLTVMDGPLSARGLMTAGWRLLAAHEKTVTFFQQGGNGLAQPFWYRTLGHTDGSLMPRFRALWQSGLRASSSSLSPFICSSLSIFFTNNKFSGGFRIFSHRSMLIRDCIHVTTGLLICYVRICHNLHLDCCTY